ncbi:uncharacterized protein M421DRAFT_176757 [Didymella exigua CBS 183.55]|uniref:C3H1-type domain-containing protein n=1 Tax=Didymella exigua CBS 183.55 TaxID=1150837 RepID=A0A6A5RJM9_9PLEO|nr:uncharacterized protein M421DRAFT_176757 [Didymella exigua CBS 183.55]KAF1927308.1 hypothetical protein M421DRAFT_176757 [Didymella exigua CBS 183.55]
MHRQLAPEIGQVGFSLHRDEEEDLVDYGDSDAEADTSNNQETSAAEEIEQIDIFADDAIHAEVSDQNGDTKANDKESTEEPAVPTTSTSPLATAKTVEAAIVIKSLNLLLTGPNFRAALGLVEAGSTLDLGFWADGFDFALSLKLIGAAEVKACKYKAECRSKECTFDHGGADRTAVIAGKKPRKLCSVINTPAGCPNGDACWFSHEAFGVSCPDGDLRAGCVKGIYCVYKHNDDEVVASIEHGEQPEGQIENGEETNAPKASVQNAHVVKSAVKTNMESAPPAPATRTTASSKQQASGIKRRREPDHEAGGRPEKFQRSYKHQNRQERPGGRNSRRGSAPERADSKNPSQGPRDSGQLVRENRDCGRGRKGGRGGRGGRGGKSDSYCLSEGRQRDGRYQKKVPLEKRMSRS